MERRGQERVLVRPVRRGTSITRVFPHRVTDISKTGCAIESRESLDVQNGRVVFELPLPARVDSLPLAARVVWARYGDASGSPQYRYGLCFEEIDLVSRSILDAYLEFLRRDVHIVKLEEAWTRLKDVQQRIELMVACEERKAVTFLN